MTRCVRLSSLCVASALLASCWLPSTAEYQARKNRAAREPEPPPFELHRPARPFRAPASTAAAPAARTGLVAAPGPRDGGLAAGLDGGLDHGLGGPPDAALDERLRTRGVRFTLDRSAAEKARDATVLASYDIRALTFGVTDFVAPRIDTLYLSNGAGDDERFGRAGETHRALDEERVVELIEAHVAAGTWDADGTSLAAQNGVLFVRHTPQVQREVQSFLRRLGG